MKLTVLLENKSVRADCAAAHGLALDIQTPKQHILFDTGPEGLLAGNARALGIDLSDVDLCVLSHGHYDHGGDLAYFLRENGRAPVYARSGAFLPHAVARGGQYEDIGIAPELLEQFPGRFRFDAGVLDEELTLFSDIHGADFLTEASKTLLQKTAEGYESDPFTHEQNLLIRAGGKWILIGGCAHRGIVNILARAEELAGAEMDWVFAGFHLTNPGLGIDEPAELIEGVGRALLERKRTRYVTGHCTGDGPTRILQGMLGSRLSLMPAGSVFEL